MNVPSRFEMFVKDIANEAADITMTREDLLTVPKLVLLSRKAILNIKQNLFLSFAYNIIAIPVAAYPFSFSPLLSFQITKLLFSMFPIYAQFLLLHLRYGLLNPMIAAAAMSLSSVCVVTNSLRLKNVRLLPDSHANTIQKGDHVVIEINRDL